MNVPYLAKDYGSVISLVLLIGVELGAGQKSRLKAESVGEVLGESAASPPTPPARGVG